MNKIKYATKHIHGIYTLGSNLPGVPGRFRFLLADAGFEVGLGIGFELGCGSWMNPLSDEERSSGDNILDLNLYKEVYKKNWKA